jgi:hypothetical protein
MSADHRLLRRSTLAHAGRDDHVLRRRAREGVVVKLAPGTYVESQVWSEADDRQKHLLRAHAVLGRLTAPVVVSHETALASHGFPLLGRWPERVHVVDPARQTTLSTSRLIRHAVDLPEGDVVLGAGTPTTTAVRAALDVARSRDLRGGAVVLDHGLRSGAFTLDEASEVLERRRSSPGSRAAAIALAFADGLADSAGESLSRAGLLEAGLVRPVLQKEFHDASGYIGRVDFWWPCCGVVGEFDGLVKYLGRTERRGRTAEQVVVDEKVREDRIRALPEVNGFARWLWNDALRTAPMVAAVRAAGLAGCRHSRVC